MTYSTPSNNDNTSYPASKNEIIEKEEARGATQEEVSSLRNISEDTYNSATEVAQALNGTNQEGDGSMENSSASSQGK